MRQLSGLDTSFLTMETPTTFGHVSGLLLLDPDRSTEPFAARLRAVVEARLHLLGPFRWRLVEVPFGLDRPYWVNDPAFDLDLHLREVTLPPPGGDEQLAALVGDLVARPLDRRRPLWELHVVHGLASGQVAVLAKMHHAAIDGAAGLELLSALMDLEPEPRDVDPPDAAWEPERVPGEFEMLNRGYLGLLRRPAQLLQAQQRAWKGMSGGVAPTLPATPAPRTPFNRAITGHRRYAFGTLPLEAVKAVKNAHGVTVNDVVLAVCTGAVRRWLLDHDELPGEPLRALVPVSVRAGEGASEGDAFGNRISTMVVDLPTDDPDPSGQLERVHDAADAAKQQLEAVPAGLLQDFSLFATPAVMADAARLIASLRLADYVNPPVNLVVSNVPGPGFPLYCAGARLAGMYPASAIGDGMGLNVTVISYLGRLHFGLVACPELVPDLDRLLGYLGDALADLEPAS
jgi:WS/DGAT/MGAT family acyltransferase